MPEENEISTEFPCNSYCCYSCGKLIGNRWEKYLQMILRKAEEQEKEDRENPEDKTKPKPAPEKEVLDELGFTRHFKSLKQQIDCQLTHLIHFQHGAWFLLVLGLQCYLTCREMPVIPRAGQWHVSSRYEVKNIIGSGSYGSVCEAYDKERDQNVAIKRVKHMFDDLVDCKRILRETAIMTRLSHPHIVQIYDIIELSPQLCDSDMKKLIKTDVLLTPLHINTLLYNLLVGPGPNAHPHQLVQGARADLAAGPLFPGSSCYPLSPDRKHRKDPRFHTRGSTDQLNVIFDLLGTPSEAEIAQLQTEEAKQHIRALARRERKGVRSRFPDAPEESMDLLEKTLKFTPMERIVVDAALDHDLFKDIRDRKVETVAPSPVILEFDKEPDLGEAVLRKGFAEEIAKFHKASSDQHCRHASPCFAVLRRASDIRGFVASPALRCQELPCSLTESVAEFCVAINGIRSGGYPLTMPNHC
eukprot:Skav223765  [mRNA]  locus=scaffold521:33360:41741:- [translate_table: standard]